METTTKGAGMTVYLQATTAKLHKIKDCSITRRTRYNHFPMEYNHAEHKDVAKCHKCWGGG